MTSLNDLKKSIEENIDRIILALNTERMLSETIKQLKLDLAQVHIDNESMSDRIVQLTSQNEALNSILNQAIAANLEFRRENDHVKSLLDGMGIKRFLYQCGDKRRLEFEVHFNKMISGLSGADEFDQKEMDFVDIVNLFHEMQMFSKINKKIDQVEKKNIAKNID